MTDRPGSWCSFARSEAGSHGRFRGFVYFRDDFYASSPFTSRTTRPVGCRHSHRHRDLAEKCAVKEALRRMLDDERPDPSEQSYG